jgi:hypothetical protein
MDGFWGSLAWWDDGLRIHGSHWGQCRERGLWVGIRAEGSWGNGDKEHGWGHGAGDKGHGWGLGGVLGGHGEYGGIWEEWLGLGGWAAKGNNFLQGESAMTRSRGAQGLACVNTTRRLKMYSGF